MQLVSVGDADGDASDGLSEGGIEAGHGFGPAQAGVRAGGIGIDVEVRLDFVGAHIDEGGGAGASVGDAGDVDESGVGGEVGGGEAGGGVVAGVDTRRRKLQA